MPDKIKDGLGRGYEAAVNAENLLQTKAVMETHLMHHTLDHEDMYVAHWEHNQVVDATDELAGYISYSGTNNLMIAKVIISTNSAGECAAEFFVDPTTVAGGATVTPTNMNLGSNKSLASVTTKDSNKGATPITTAANGTEIFSYRIGWQAQPTLVHDMEDALSLSNGNTFMIQTKQATAGDKFRVSIFYFEEPAR